MDSSEIKQLKVLAAKARADPQWADRDRFVLSKGHCCPSLYAVLALKGFFDWNELTVLRHVGAMLQGHPDMKRTPGIDMSTGSLGQGVSAACGMALAGKLDKKDYRVYTVLGDGEVEEGQVWEAAMFAAHNKLDNLTLFVDQNGLQIDGSVEQVCGIEPLDKKFEAFGFEVIKIDGHDFEQIHNAVEKAKTVKGKPTAILAKTVKGKGVSFMENQVGWHGVAPNKEQYEAATAELRQERALARRFASLPRPIPTSSYLTRTSPPRPKQAYSKRSSPSVSLTAASPKKTWSA